MPATGQILLLLQLASALFMTGLIWLVQLVHYPLFAAVGREEFSAYEAAHTSQISVIVIPIMLVELASAVGLVVSPPDALGRTVPVVALVLLAIIWVVTALYSVPAHGALSGGFDPTAHRTLVSTNWIRTVAWTGRAALLTWMLAQLLRRT